MLMLEYVLGVTVLVVVVGFALNANADFGPSPLLLLLNPLCFH